MRICPKCTAYYANDSSGFCLIDGTPVVNVDPGSDKWSEGTRVIEAKENALRRQKRKLKWRRVALSTMLIATMVVCVVAINRWVYVETVPLRPTPIPTPSPSPSPTPSPVYKISGRVTDAGKPLGGVGIRLEGAMTVSTTTDANGRFIFNDLAAGGTYTISPAGPLTFKPLNRSFDKLRRDESADFTVEVFKISGRVMSGAGPLRRIKILLEGSSVASATTDTNGYYAFGNLRAGGSYTITPRAQLKFEPPHRFFEKLRRDESVGFFQTDATPTPTPTPTPECSEHAMNLEAEAIVRDSTPGWERMVKGERNLIRDKYAAGFKNPEFSLGKIAYHIRFLKPCEAFVVTATYAWQVHLPGNAVAPDETKSVRRERKFTCEKRRGAWRCR